MTFSIIAHDPDEKAWGVAVASKFLAAAAVVSWAQAGAGAVATQSYANMSFGPDGLRMMAEGKTAQETLHALLAADELAEERQVALIDQQGNVATHTGKACMDWAGHKTGPYFSCQGNILVGESTLTAMADAFKHTEGELADRLMAALLAGDTAGGDRRGKQSAGLIIVKQDGGYGGKTDRHIDLRVDDDPEPVSKLKGLLASHHLFFGQMNPADLIDITPQIAIELQNIMLKAEYFAGEANGEWDDMCKQALWSLIANENLEERWNLSNDTDKIDRVTLDYLKKRFK